MIRTVLALASACLFVEAIVPQVQLCEYSECPSVSRMGMGTLHLGDSISGIKSPQEINAWIQKALSFGINLFDLADVMLPFFPIFASINVMRRFIQLKVAMLVLLRHYSVKPLHLPLAYAKELKLLQKWTSYFPLRLILQSSIWIAP
jgi:hypothetical protein